jgi:16S rRNA C1402 N4-methylase RsmH
MSYGFIAVRPNGDISFSCNMGNPYTFGKAYDSIRIPVNKDLMAYIDLLRKAEEATLQESQDKIVEFDVMVDKYIKILSVLK